MLELIVVLMLIAMVMNYAVPSYQLMMQRQHMRISKDSFNTSLVLAHNTSIARDQQVMLCPTSDSLSCESEKFEQGWIVFFDLNKNGQSEPSIEALIWVQILLVVLVLSNSHRGQGKKVIYLESYFNNSLNKQLQSPLLGRRSWSKSRA